MLWIAGTRFRKSPRWTGEGVTELVHSFVMASYLVFGKSRKVNIISNEERTDFPLIIDTPDS